MLLYLFCIFNVQDEEPTWDPSVDSGTVMYNDRLSGSLEEDNFMPASDHLPAYVAGIHQMPPESPANRSSMYSSTDTFLTAADSVAHIASLDSQIEVNDDDDDDDEKDKTLTREQHEAVREVWDRVQSSEELCTRDWNDVNEKRKSITFGKEDRANRQEDPSRCSTSSEASTVHEADPNLAANNQLKGQSRSQLSALPDILGNKSKATNDSNPAQETTANQLRTQGKVPDEGDERKDHDLVPEGTHPLQPPVYGYSPGILPKKHKKRTS